MTIATIREKLQEYIKTADAEKIKAIFTLVENDIRIEDRWFQDQEFLDDLDQRFKDYKAGIDKGSTFKEVKSEILKFKYEKSTPNILLDSPRMLQKTALKHIIANETDVNIKITSDPDLDKPDDLTSLVTNLHSDRYVEYNIALCLKAQKELSQSYKWVERQQSGLGLEFLNQVNKDLKFISYKPQFYALENRDYRELIMKNFPFTILYKFDESNYKIIIVSIFHSKINPKFK